MEEKNLAGLAIHYSNW